MATRWHVAKDASDWLARALDFVRRAETAALDARGEFHIVLAGGETPGRLYAALAGESHDWPRWQVWFGDERCRPPEHPERNSCFAADRWLKRLMPPGTNIHAVPAELGALAGAEAYARALSDVGAFDLVLLGLGEDAHTASLFPGQDWGESAGAPAALPVFGAPKPPAERVSLSAQRLSNAHTVLFLVSGAGKRDAVSAWRAGARLPAAAIQPPGGVDVLIDQSAYGVS